MRTFIVDAFTDKAYKGNPAAVCITKKSLSEIQMQKIASEINLSETAFLSPTFNGFILRWFTPKTEVDLCGHATLASAFILYKEDMHPCDKPIFFNTKSGLISAQQLEDKIEIEFPLFPLFKSSVNPSKLMKVLGLKKKTWHNILENQSSVLIEVESTEVLNSVNPKFSLLQHLPKMVIVTSKSDNEFDFESRVFAPFAGINEDPVTGSAHSTLVYYWNKRLGKEKFKAFQSSLRTGEIECEISKQKNTLIRGNCHLINEYKNAFPLV